MTQHDLAQFFNSHPSASTALTQQQFIGHQSQYAQQGQAGNIGIVQYTGQRPLAELIEKHKKEEDPKMCAVPTLPEPKEKVSMFKSLSEDLKGFMRENKTVIYWIALIMIVDHYFFEDAFREKLKGIVHKLIGKVEEKVTSEPTKSA